MVKISVSQCELSGSMLKLHRLLVKGKQWSVIYAWIQLLQFHQLHQEIVLVTLKLIVLHQVEFGL